MIVNKFEYLKNNITYMIKDKKILTIITARKGSKGLKDKNIKKIKQKKCFCAVDDKVY